jgi:VanZ family protein
LQQIFFLKTQNRFILPAMGWFILTTVLLVLPLPVVPEEKWFLNIPLFDKWVHIGLFAMLTVLLCWGLYKRKKSAEILRSHFITIGITCLVYGIVMEFIQKYFVPNRSFDGGDIIADGVGAALGCLFSIRRYIKK